MRLSHGFDLTGLDGCFFAEAQRPEHDVQGIADVLQFVVQLVAVAIEVVLQALEQVCREVTAA